MWHAIFSLGIFLKITMQTSVILHDSFPNVMDTSIEEGHTLYRDIIYVGKSIRLLDGSTSA